MPPKVKVTKAEIVKAALAVVREHGAGVLNARTVAAVLNCSTQPIFSNFSTMDELRLAVVEQADILCQEYMQREEESGVFPAYKANGMAYIRFAKEEKELFKLLYMRDRSRESISSDSEHLAKMEDLVYDNTGLSGLEAKLFHLEIWAYVHGIAAMFATGFLNLDWDLVSKMITDMYQGLRKQYGKE
ncbi:MAG: TetR/AcrR family transcriptional regulator [Clostridia bacterium]|nr:TetR/AcrR family transcriptional regulator [Clostridia bacterium]